MERIDSTGVNDGQGTSVTAYAPPAIWLWVREVMPVEFYRPTSVDDVRSELAPVVEPDDTVPCHAGMHMVPTAEVVVITDSGAVCWDCAREIDAAEFVHHSEPCDVFASAGPGLTGDSERVSYCLACGWEVGDHVPTAESSAAATGHEGN